MNGMIARYLRENKKMYSLYQMNAVVYNTANYHMKEEDTVEQFLEHLVEVLVEENQNLKHEFTRPIYQRKLKNSTNEK